MARPNEVATLRERRLDFERALRDGVSVIEAGKRRQLDRIAERDARIAALRNAPADVTAAAPAVERPSLWFNEGPMA